MSWSKILHTSTAKSIQKAMTSGLEYHNWNHVLACYSYLEKAGVIYDENLDYAVLFQIVYMIKKHIKSSDLETTC